MCRMLLCEIPSPFLNFPFMGIQIFKTKNPIEMYKAAAIKLIVITKIMTATK